MYNWKWRNLSKVAGLNKNRRETSSDKKHNLSYVSFCFSPSAVVCRLSTVFFIDSELNETIPLKFPRCCSLFFLQEKLFGDENLRHTTPDRTVETFQCNFQFRATQSSCPKGTNSPPSLPLVQCCFGLTAHVCISCVTVNNIAKGEGGNGLWICEGKHFCQGEWKE